MSKSINFLAERATQTSELQVEFNLKWIQFFKQFLNGSHSLVGYLDAQTNQSWIATAQSLSGKMNIISPKIPSLRKMEIMNTFYPSIYSGTLIAIKSTAQLWEAAGDPYISVLWKFTRTRSTS